MHINLIATYPEFGWWEGLSKIQIMETVLYIEGHLSGTQSRELAILIKNALEESGKDDFSD